MQLKNVLLISTLLMTNVLHAEEDSWGVEVNPFRLILLTEGSGSQSFSGTISHFDNSNGIEIAMPIYFSKDKSDYYGGSDNDTETVLDIDLRYRKYFEKKTEGAYIGGFGRYTYLDGRANDISQYATVKKFGLGLEVGMRVKRIFDTPFYWGASLGVGAYLGDNNDIFHGSGITMALSDNQYILDVELFKVGYEF